jgi:hypothetical protein
MFPCGGCLSLAKHRPPSPTSCSKGSIDPRRKAILASRSIGFAFRAVFGVCGKDRDGFIGHVKLIRNVQFYEAKVLEMVRLSYPARPTAATVLSACSSDPVEDVFWPGECRSPSTSNSRCVWSTTLAELTARDETSYLVTD